MTYMVRRSVTGMITKISCSIALLIAMAVAASAQDPPELYAAGQFPAGNVYQESDLPGLVGTELPDPSYLVGRFVYLGLISGRQTFSSFMSGPNEGEINFGKTLIDVTFFGNISPGLAVGKVIVSTSEEPLTIRRVSRSADGALLLVAAESWSLPSSDNKTESNQ